ncbi:UDP-glycosyltransferase UGT5-like isoform X2 [Lycorma delicatula]
MLAVTHALAKKGHNLTVITPNPSKVPVKNHRDVDISFLYEKYAEAQKDKDFTMQEKLSTFKFFSNLPAIFHFLSTNILNSSPVKQLIKEIKENNIKYDLIIYEVVPHSALLGGFSEITGNPPVVGVLTMNENSNTDIIFGNPLFPSYVPCVLQHSTDKMSFFERFNSLLYMIYYEYILKVYNADFQERLMKEHFGNFQRTADEKNYNISLLIVSSDLAFSYPKPNNPNVVQVGPLHIKKQLEPLPQDIKKWMDEAENGVIYFSLGSNMKGTSFPEEKRSAFIKAFSKFPKVRVLWKWEADTKLPGQPDNVFVKKWLPQQSILAHPNIVLFISQAGLQSLQEAVHYVVPVLAVPIYGDQEYNARKLLDTGAGLELDFYNITYESVYDKLEKFLTSTSYKENMKRVSAISKDRPMPPVDTAIWWVEYVLRHNGAPHLRPASLSLKWYQLYMVDLFLFIAAVILLLLLIIRFIFKKIFSIFSILKHKEHKQKTN